MSLRRRLLLGLLTIGAVLIFTNVTLSQRFERYLLERIDAQLIDATSGPLFLNDRPQRPGQRGPQPQDETLSEYFIAVGVPERAMVRVGSSIGDDTRPIPDLDSSTVRRNAGRPGLAVPFTVPAETGSGEWRLVSVVSGRDRITIVGLGLDQVDATVARTRLVQLLGTLAVLSTLGLVSWWVLRLGVYPIEDLAATADAIAAGDLSRRVEHPGPATEAGRLGVAFNAMLERIQGAFREREASEERVRRFAADASHELRTPLTSILGYTELWRAGGLQGSDQLGDAMSRMEDEGRRMAALVEDLLVLARLDQNRQPEHAPVRLDLLAADAVRDAQAVEPSRPIESALAPVTVSADEAEMRQVLGNLLANARVHTPADTPIRVSVGQVEGRVVLEVADRGPGMTPEIAAQVFDRFYRADASRGRGAGGTGLGLAIVQGIVAGSGGTVRVESAVGAGSRFIVELPA